MPEITLSPAEVEWLTRFCPGLKAGGQSCLEASPHTLCQACFTHGSVRALLQHPGVPTVMIGEPGTWAFDVAEGESVTVIDSASGVRKVDGHVTVGGAKACGAHNLIHCTKCAKVRGEIR